MAKTRMIKTKNGNEVPLLDLQGKDYLPVASRIAMFREEHPNGAITTEALSITDNFATFKATVHWFNSDTKAYQMVSTGYARVTQEEFPSYTEKAETAAVGRALIAAGYGTLQCGDELAEDVHLADAPIERPNAKKEQPKAGAGNSNRANAKSPGTLQAVPAGNSAAAAPKPGGAQSAGAEGANPLPPTSTRKEVNNLISSLSYSVVAKRIMSKTDIVGFLQEKYGVATKEALSDAQAEEVMQHLHKLNNPTLQSAAV